MDDVAKSSRVDLIFEPGSFPGGWLVRWWTRLPQQRWWTVPGHCALIVDDVRYEATVKGVQARASSASIYYNPGMIGIVSGEAFPIEVPDCERLRAYCEHAAAICERYDWLRILSCALRRILPPRFRVTLDCTDEEICSELVARALRAGGVPICVDEIACPNDLREWAREDVTTRNVFIK